MSLAAGFKAGFEAASRLEKWAYVSFCWPSWLFAILSVYFQIDSGCGTKIVAVFISKTYTF